MKRCMVRLLILSIVALAVVSGGVRTADSYVLPPPNNCVGIASDSNGFGQVTFQLPPEPDGDVGIIFVRPLDVVLRPQLDARGLTDLAIMNRSLSAGSLTAAERTNYLKSSPYGSLIA